MVSTKSGKKVTIDVPTPPMPPAMLGEEANLGLVFIDLGADTKTQESWLTEGDDDEVTHMLQLHQITVGKDAAKGEEQIIEAEFAISGIKKAVTPIAFLTRGQCNLLQTDIRLPAGTIFRLSGGKGPVHVLGSHIVSPTPEEDVIESDMEEDDEDADDVAEEDEKVSNNKRKAIGEGENDAKKFKNKNGASSGDETATDEPAPID